MFYKAKLVFTLFIAISTINCNNGSIKNTNTETKSGIQSEKYPNDSYCAEVKYSNPNTSTRSSYTLVVIVENNEIVKIIWPNGGSISDEHFQSSKIDNHGYTAFIDEKGCQYEIQITGQSSGCMDNIPQARQCLGKTKKGKRCKQMSDNKNGFCWLHQNQVND